MDLNFLKSSNILVDVACNECLFQISPTPNRKHNYFILDSLLISYGLALRTLAIFFYN